MKKLFLIFAILTAGCSLGDELVKNPVGQDEVVDKFESDVVIEYKAQIKKCETIADEKNNAEDIEIWQIRNNSSEQFLCYNKIADEIIEKYYAEYSDMQKNSDNFIQSSINLSHSIYSDVKDCYPYCGTITIEQGQITNLHFVKFYIEQLLEQINTMEYLNNNF